MELVANPLYLSTASATFESDFQARLHWSDQADAAIEQRVAEILADVQLRGDAAVLEYTRRYDALDVPSVATLALSPAELRQAFDAIPNAQRQATAARPWLEWPADPVTIVISSWILTGRLSTA